MERLVRKLKSWVIGNKLRSVSPALLYHKVGADIPMKQRDPNLHFVSVSVLLQHVQFLRKKMTFLGAEDFIEAVCSNTSKSVACLTFDDGYSETWNSTVPILEENKIPSVFYVNSSLVSGEILWRDKIRHIISQNKVNDFIRFSGLTELNEEKFYRDTKNPLKVNSLVVKEYVDKFFAELKTEAPQKTFSDLNDLKSVEQYQYTKLGNHTANHLVLSSLSHQQQLSEIGSCQTFLSSNFSKQKISEIFSMPFGGETTYNEDTLSCLKQLHFKGAFVSDTPAYLKSKDLKIQSSDGFVLYKRYLPKYELEL